VYSVPELPEVETSRRGISPHIERRVLKQLIIRNHSLRWPVPEDLPQLLEGKKLLRVERRGKYLLLVFTHGTALVHLGMSGSVQIVSAAKEPGKHDHVDFVFGLDTVLRYNDPRRFGLVLWTNEPIEQHRLIAHLGPEPLSDDFHWEYLFQASRKRKQALKTFLMDSKTVVGVGNIYANESLFMAGLRPGRAAGGLTKAKAQLLVGKIKEVLSKAIEQGGTSLKDFVGGDGKPGYFAQHLFVYGREGQPCLICAERLKHGRIAQRATVYCPKCQS